MKSPTRNRRWKSRGAIHAYGPLSQAWPLLLFERFLPFNPYLIVEAREEPPVHGKHPADVARRRDFPHVAQVDVRVVARHAAEVLHEGVVGFQVVVEPEHPAGVELGDELQVVDDALEVLALFRQLRVRVSIKCETYRLKLRGI